MSELICFEMAKTLNKKLFGGRLPSNRLTSFYCSVMPERDHIALCSGVPTRRFVSESNTHVLSQRNATRISQDQ